MPDNAEQRQQKILQLLRANPLLTIQELVEHLGVSTMTVHRDLSKLAEAGALVKTRGGAAAAPAKTERDVPPEMCAMCARAVPARTALVIKTLQRGYLSACCPHCGLALLVQEPSFEMALAADFIYGRMVGVSDAAYLVGSSVTLCCQPSLLAFGSLDDAGGFQRGFGGVIMGLGEALDYLRARMAMHRSADIMLT